MANPILKLGLPKGSLEDPTIDLFDRAGWKVRKHPRNYFPDINDPEITARLCRVQEIPLYIQDGVLDLGLTGKDWVKETKADVVVVSDLIYSKVSNKPARWVLAVADDSPYQKPEDLAGKRIATELMGVCTEYFKERNIPVNINYSWGATEAKVVEGLADAIVEVTETETTIRAHDLRVIDEVLVTNTVLIANAAAMQDPEKRADRSAPPGRTACRVARLPQDERPRRQAGRRPRPAALPEFPHRRPASERRMALS